MPTVGGPVRPAKRERPHDSALPAEIAMIRWLTILVLALGSAAAGLQPAAAAEAVSPADASGVRAVVQGQLDALAADDAAKAFSYASPDLRLAFGTPDRFMAMVRRSYAVVLRPAAVAFAAPEANGAEILQRVHFTDPGGVLWLAIYRLQRQDDNNWRIAGCQLLQSRAQAT
jgi:hypothetical protein